MEDLKKTILDLLEAGKLEEAREKIDALEEGDLKTELEALYMEAEEKAEKEEAPAEEKPKTSKDYNAKDAIAEAKKLEGEGRTLFLEGEDRKSVLDAMAPPPETPKGSASVKVKKPVKKTSPEAVLKKFDAFIEEAARLESQKRLEGSHSSFHTRFRKKMEAERLQFKKFTSR